MIYIGLIDEDALLRSPSRSTRDPLSSLFRPGKVSPITLTTRSSTASINPAIDLEIPSPYARGSIRRTDREPSLKSLIAVLPRNKSGERKRKDKMKGKARSCLRRRATARTACARAAR